MVRWPEYGRKDMVSVRMLYLRYYIRSSGTVTGNANCA